MDKLNGKKLKCTALCLNILAYKVLKDLKTISSSLNNLKKNNLKLLQLHKHNNL